MINGIISRTGAVPANYALMLFGILFFPIQFIAMSFARKRRLTGEAWEQSHYTLQYRTAAVTLWAEGGLFLIGMALMLSVSPKDYHEAIHLQLWLIVIRSAKFAVFGWLIVRAIRGLFLAGSQSAIIHPRSYTIWPL